MRKSVTGKGIKEYILRETLMAKILKSAESKEYSFEHEKEDNFYWDVVDSVNLEMPVEREAIYYSLALSALMDGKAVTLWFPNDRRMSIAIRKEGMSIMPDSPDVLPTAKQIKHTVKCIEDYIKNAKES